MRVLLAIDGSAPSDRARQLVAGIAWPSGSSIRVVTAVDYRTEFAPVPWLIPSVSEIGRVRAAPVDVSPPTRRRGGGHDPRT